MKKLIGIVFGMASMLVTSIAFAQQPLLDWGTEVNAGECDKIGSPVVNVTYKIINSMDSGEGGNYWAYDNLNRHIQVWKSSADNKYCAVVRDLGKFDAQEGQLSPGKNGYLEGDEDGNFEGGYRATLTGNLKDTPTWKTKGNLDTIDYNCNVISRSCTGVVTWYNQYFESGVKFAYNWWGWIYRGEKNNNWVNASTGNLGDIIED